MHLIGGRIRGQRKNKGSCRYVCSKFLESSFFVFSFFLENADIATDRIGNTHVQGISDPDVGRAGFELKYGGDHDLPLG